MTKHTLKTLTKFLRSTRRITRQVDTMLKGRWVMYFVEIWFKRGNVPLIEYMRTEEDAARLFNAAAHGWKLRRYGKDGAVICEEKR